MALAVCALATVAETSFAADEAEVRIKSQAVIERSVITLGDVADVWHRESQMQSRLEGILVGPAPRAGETVRVTFSSVRSHLRDYGVDLTRVRFSGSSVISVTSGRQKQLTRYAGYSRSTRQRDRDQRRAQDAVAKAVQQYLNRAVPELGMVSVRVRIPADDIPDVLTAVQSGYNIHGGSPPWDRPQIFSVRFLDQRKKLHEVRIEGQIEKHPYVLAAKYALPKGTLIRANDLIWKQVAAVKAGAVTQFRDAVGLEATRAIRVDESIGKSNVHKVPLVRSNQIVTVFSGRGGIRVTRQMKARGNGAAGETIQAVSLNGRDRILVRVTGPREAEVAGADPRPSDRIQDRTGSIRFVEADRIARGTSSGRRRSPARTTSRFSKPVSRR